MTQPVQEPTLDRSVTASEFRTRQLARRPSVSSPFNIRLHIKVDPDDVIVVSGNDRFIFAISEDMDGLVLTAIEIYVTSTGSGSIVQVQLRNETQAQDMLSTLVQIDAGELNSKDSATQPVIDTANDDVAWGDHIAIDVDQDGTDAMGLGVMLTFGAAAT